jgi:toxin CptA
MNDKYSDANAMLTLAPSRRLAAFIVAAAGASLALLAFMPGPVAARLLAGAWCVAIAIHAVRRAVATRRIRIAGTAVSVEERGSVREGRIVGGSFVAPWLTIVHWRPESARLTRTIVIVPDMAEAESFRALRVVLRWG